MKLFHTTSESLLNGILADGFPSGDGEAWNIRLTNRRPDPPTSGDRQASLLFDIPEEAIRGFELDEVGTTARTFAVPGKVLNRYPVLAVQRYGQSERLLPPAPGATPSPRPSSPRGSWQSVPRRSRPRWPIALAALGLLLLLAGGGYAISRATDDDDGSKPAPRANKPPAPKRERPARPSDSGARNRSVAVGTLTNGRLENGVPLPATGKDHFTWNVASKSSPNPRGRRYATDYVVRAVLRVVRSYRAKHKGVVKVGIADLSRSRGGDFGPRNQAHENGLAVDVLYPRSDGGESEATAVEQVDRQLAQDLLDAFARGGARKIIVDPRLGLTGPKGVVEQTSSDASMHVLFPKRS